MSSCHRIQEENKVIAQTIGMELSVISFQLKIFSVLVKFTIKIFTGSEQFFPLYKHSRSKHYVTGLWNYLNTHVVDIKHLTV